MKLNHNYLFKSNRLGFRNWTMEDMDQLHELNSDKAVMEFFPSLQSKDQSIEFIERMRKQFDTKGFCYFAVYELIENQFIGFIGLSEQTYEAEFTPCIDIGWRIKKEFWNKGYATEGATKCIEYAFNQLNLEKLYSIAPIINLKSIAIMTKIGMKKQFEFEHPFLKNDLRLRSCVVYSIENSILKA